MPSPKDAPPRLIETLREARPADLLGWAATAVGLVLVAVGIILEENRGVSFGATIRVLGGLLLLGGLGAVLFGESRRRAAVIGAARRAAKRYLDATDRWRWTDRWGVAGVAVGLVMVAPAVAAQIIFGDPFGVLVVAPGLVLFWGGVVLLLYWRIYRLYLAFRRRSAGRGDRR